LLEDKIDDILSEFKDNESINTFIDDIRDKYIKTWINTLNKGKNFYLDNKVLNKKDFAVKAGLVLGKNRSFAAALEYYDYFKRKDFYLENKDLDAETFKLMANEKLNITFNKPIYTEDVAIYENYEPPFNNLKKSYKSSRAWRDSDNDGWIN
jgi:hypothetical protein